MNLDVGDTRLIIEEAESRGATLSQLAYILGTTWHETNETMKPVREAYWKSEDWRAANLRYYPWYGRGYVQLTWKENYAKAGDRIGADLLSTPDVAMSPRIAARILVRGMLEGWFTGAKLTDYVNESRTDYLGARRVVNGTDRAAKVAKYASDYRDMLIAEGYGRKPVKPPAAQGKGPLIAALMALGAVLFAFLKGR